MGGAAATADVFRAIADPTRRALLDKLRERDASVLDLAKPFRMSRPAVSQHLRILKEVGLVKPHRHGRRSLYRLDTRPLRLVHEWSARYFADPFGHVWSVRNAKSSPSSE